MGTAIFSMIMNRSESIGKQERKYWIEIYQSMNREQKVRFMQILVHEKKELNKLEKEYRKQISSIPKRKYEI